MSSVKPEIGPAGCPSMRSATKAWNWAFRILYTPSAMRGLVNGTWGFIVCRYRFELERPVFICLQSRATSQRENCGREAPEYYKRSTEIAPALDIPRTNDCFDTVVPCTLTATWCGISNCTIPESCRIMRGPQKIPVSCIEFSSEVFSPTLIGLEQPGCKKVVRQCIQSKP